MSASGRDDSHNTPSLAVGQIYAQRYRVDALIGRGGMGEVYRVRDLTSGTDLALKILHAASDRFESDGNGAERFRREIGLLSKLNHPGILRIVDSGEHEGRLFLVSELVDGHSLEEDARKATWPAAEAAALVATVAEALSAAHAAGIVHRDIKPSNIMIAGGGSIRLLDFGLARPTGVDTTMLTRVGVIVGTPTYMSPEQFDSRFVDRRSDIYSLGVVLFELLTGRPPFVADTVIGMALMHKHDDPPSPRAARADIPPWLDRVVLRCLEKDPEKRFSTARDLAAELRKARNAGPHTRRLPSGDVVLEDDVESGGWALELQSERRKTGWTRGMVLLFYDRYYKLEQVCEPESAASWWVYRFEGLPSTEVIRKLVDYREDCREQTKPAASFWSKLSARRLFR